MTKSRKVNTPAATTPVVSPILAAALFAPEADFDDTIARNRGLPLLDAHTIPPPPVGFRPTDPETRRARLRRFAGELRSESMDALREAAGRDLQAELGQFAPKAERAAALVERLTTTSNGVSRAEALLAYEREIDQIALSDAFAFLDLENKQYTNAVDHDASLLQHYRALAKLFAARSAAIAEGMAQAKTQDTSKPAPDGKTPA
jgi:hypothetical protein